MTERGLVEAELAHGGGGVAAGTNSSEPASIFGAETVDGRLSPSMSVVGAVTLARLTAPRSQAGEEVPPEQAWRW